MNRTEFFKDLELRLDKIIPEYSKLRSLSVESLNTQTSAHHWTIGQMLDHLSLGHKPLLKGFQENLSLIPSATSDGVQLSWIGKLLVRGAGPNGGAPVPKPFIPGNGPYDLQSVETVVNELEDLRAFFPKVSDKAVDRFKLQSPVSKWLRYTVADAMAMMVGHAEHHLMQIQSICKAGHFLEK